MIARILSFLFIVSAVAALGWEGNSAEGWTLEGVDPNTLSCDPLGQVFLLLPHRENCSQFYMCVHGEEVLFNCSDPLEFDFYRQTCNWPWAFDCLLRNKHEEEGSGFDGEIAIMGDEAFGGVAAASSHADLFNSILNCNRADSAAKQVAYKGDCQRYWKCVDGLPQSVYCSDGLFFNESTMQCDHEANVHCAVQIEDELKGEFMVTE